MGLFDWVLGREKRHVTSKPDRIWLSRPDMYRGLPDHVLSESLSTALTVVVTQFAITHNEIKTILTDRVPFREIIQPGDWFKAAQPGSIVMISADTLKRMESPAWPENADSIKLIVCERHFLRERDDAIAAFGEQFARPGSITFHCSLDDAVLRIFITDNVVNFLRNSNNKEPWLESSMVSNSIRKAQSRLVSRVIAQDNTASPEEWVQKNMK